MIANPQERLTGSECTIANPQERLTGLECTIANPQERLTGFGQRTQGCSDRFSSRRGDEEDRLS